MSDGDRPRGTATPLRALRGGSRTQRLPSLASPAEVARRLATLERQVEEALEASRITPVSAQPAVRTALDRGLAVIADAQRVLADGWSGLAPGGPVLHTALQGLYHFWWRVETVGLERIPRTGPVVVTINRAGTWLPVDALMTALAIAQAQGAGRWPRLLLDGWLLRVPGVAGLLRDIGAVPATARNARLAVEAGEVAVVFAEGAEAVCKPFARAYRVAALARGAFLRVAVETATPIVPVAVVGAEEVAPVLWRIPLPPTAIGAPAIPVTATFPWLGALGLLPLPTKWRMLAGDPLEPGPAGDAQAMRRLRAQLRERLQGIVSEGVRRRRSVFFG